MKANEYNYRHFHVRHYDWVNFPGPKAGTKAVDFSALTLNGDRVKLSEFFGKPIVLETGSLSCPMYVRGIAQRATLAQRHPDVHFLVLYVREAHPGGKITAHTRMQDKLALARRLPKEEHEIRTILVDDMEGSVHRLYSGFPNSVYVINAQGLVVCRCDWANSQRIEEVLSNLGQADDRERVQPRPPTPRVALRVFHRAGWRSAFEFILELPRLIITHRKAVAAQTSRSESDRTKTGTGRSL